MGDTGRRRGSVRNIVDEDLPPYTDRGRYHEISDLPHNNLSRPRHNSRFSSWEEKGDTIVKDKVDMAETRERVHDSGYYRSTSPGFDGLEQQKRSNIPDKQYSQSRRYGEWRRSRGLENSRSRSPGWSRGRNRARDWNGSRSRSRSRSRSKGSTRGNSRSHSPFYDQGSESYQWSDRKSGRGRSSQTCKDFVAGMCRKGSQCRFFHSDNALREDEPLDSDVAGRWKGKQELGHGSKYHHDKAADKFSDAYYGESEPSRIRPRGAGICRDFPKGNCRYGESCRFSHSAEKDNVDRSIRNDPDHGHNSNTAGRTLCKFFLAGNCRRDSCRFSHDTPLESELEDRIHDKSGGESEGAFGKCKGPLRDELEKPANNRRVRYKSRGETVGTVEEWKGPLWDEREKPAKSRRISKWGASVDTDMGLSEDVSVDRRGDKSWGCSLEDETKAWEHDDKGLNREKYHSNSRTNDENSTSIVAAKAMVIQNYLGEPKEIMTCEEFKSHSVDELAPHIPTQNHVGEADQHYLSSPSANLHVSMTSGTHQYQEMTEHNRGPILESGDLSELKDCRNSIGQSLNTEMRSAFCDNSSLLNKKGQQMLLPISNGQRVDLHESGHVVFPSNVDEQINRHQPTIQNMPEPSAHSSFPVQAPNNQFAPLDALPIPVSNVQNIPAVHAAKGFLDEPKSQLHTVVEPSTLMAIAPSQSLLHPVPADCPQTISNSTRILDHHPRLSTLHHSGDSSNDQKARELLSSLSMIPQLSTLHQSGDSSNDQKARELLSSLSMINPQLSTLHQSGDSKVEGNGDAKKNLHEATKILEVDDNGEKMNVTSEIEADNNCSNRADDQGKEEGGSNNKDEKVIRLFKNALVELVKDILKPKWKEGKMSRDVHKTVVKKVVDKVTVTIQAEHVPRTQEKIEQYLSSNRPKISKLVQAYVERSLKAGS